MVNNKKVVMKLSEDGVKKFKIIMKTFGFANDDYFLKYCVLKTFKPKAPAKAQKQIDKEIKEILSAKKRK
jgi:hypothetical protein